MNKFKIHLETDTIIKHKNSITGIIYFDFNGILFPEKDWNDFIIVLLNNWMQSSYNILNGITSLEEFYFMDGPFFIRIQKINADECSIELIQNQSINLIEYKINMRDLFNEIFKKLTLLNRYCKKQGWETEDIKKLQYFINNI
ncbi:hypothetical protein [Chryseobacterium indoltheticum]|uniref:hypothetical protein n=1 Tax=Chryseobacterium indoltheticum TaxID=254 RepID=UPI00191279CA|nr:hypothetical protein [Chryseobacterium indoltheticum]QQQ28085.1 hypothetical protein JJL46_18760 [Chryseobacterium indoltheticum]